MKEESILKNLFYLLDEKKAENILIFDVSKVSSITDYLVICTGTSDVHISSLVDNIMKESKTWRSKIYHIEGYKLSRWVSIDFGDILLHIMGKDERELYDLESIWGDCDNVTFPVRTIKEYLKTKSNL
jgi:ribosome-associated protein